MKVGVLCFLSMALLASCEKPLLDEVSSKPKETGNVTMEFSPYTHESFTRSSAVSEVFTRLNLMLFNTSNDKVFTQVKTQTSDEEDFGTFSFNLGAGTYKVVAIGHSSSKSATISSPEKVTFTLVDGRKITDTFYYYGLITISDSVYTFNNVMKRGTAMFRLYLTDEALPDMVHTFKFTYTGGSADINPSTGKGCTNSTQNETIPVTDNNIYEVYTFPKANEGKLKVTVSALDENGDVIKQRVFVDVPITLNEITQYKGDFFTGDEANITVTTTGFTVDSEWNKTNEYTF